MSEMSLGLTAASSGLARVEPRRQFFEVSPIKLAVMSIVTLNLYQIYWFYKHWQAVKERGQDVMPLARAFFAIFFVHSLFKETVETARATSVQPSTRPGTQTLAFILLALGWRLPDPFWFLGLLAFLPLLPMQNDVARIHRALGLPPENESLTALNILAIIVGGTLIFFAILGLILS